MTRLSLQECCSLMMKMEAVLRLTRIAQLAGIESILINSLASGLRFLTPPPLSSSAWCLNCAFPVMRVIIYPGLPDS